MEYNRLIDHTLLKPDALPQEIIKLCEEANYWNFFSVCVNPAYVQLAKEKLESLNSKVKVCTVVGFPLGQTTTQQKVYETQSAIVDGADEIDMVINIAELKLNSPHAIEEIQQIKNACGKRVLKVIIETALLTDEEIARGTLFSIEGGADFVKTSTGFSKRGALVSDVQIMKRTGQDNILIKAAGGVRSFNDLVNMVNAGANRIGTSSGVRLMEEWKNNK